ncbi:MAG: carboxypeptidase regulatory-like domain-containing protein [Terriglobia bacterium]
MKNALRACMIVVILGWAGLAYGQFTSSLQGVVQDSSGAVIPGATTTLVSVATGVSQTRTADSQGFYKFVSLAPGAYRITVSARGFASHVTEVTLETEQTMNLPVTLSVASQAQSVVVSSRAPVLDTADSRTQMTLDTQALTSLPLPGRNLLNLTTLAPGVEGLGVGTADNYDTEITVDASANGRSAVGNMFVLDGLDVTSSISPTDVNLAPNPDTVQEASVQVNTFSVAYGRASSIEEVMTTKSGTNQYHGLLSDYYTAQNLQAGSEFVHNYNPFHTNNMSGTLGGPIPRLHHTYFFFGIAPLRSSASTGGSETTFESPQFVQWAQQNFPNTIGTKLLTAYPPSGATVTGVASTAAKDLGPTTCGTPAAANIPCNLPTIETGVFNATNFRNALQYNLRIDKYFSQDRIYGNYYRTGLDTGGPAVRVDMSSPSHFITKSLQLDETHTFSPSTLNEAAFSLLRVEGLNNETGPFHVPVVSVQGMDTGIGVGFAHEDFVQHHYHWRDVLSQMRGTHNLQFGYEGFRGDNLTYFADVYSQPHFVFTSLLNLVEDAPYSENSLAYNPLTGQPAGNLGGGFQYAGNTQGVFAQDTWKTSKTLTLNYGLRWDDFGNPSPENGSVLSDFFLGPGSSVDQQVANGYVKQIPHVFNHSITAFSPRAGYAWDLTGKGTWVVRGGFGIYHDWVTLGNQQGEFGNPPGWVAPTFLTGTTTAPIFAEGTSDVAPYGFPYPSFPAIGLNDHGGLVGEQLNVGALDPNLSAPDTYIYTVNVERSLGRNFVVSAGYSGSHANNLLTGFASRVGNAAYGFDINNFPGSLIQNGGKLVRLNPSFGSIRYSQNGPTSTYNAFITSFQGRFGSRGFINASYTRSSSHDDAGGYPTHDYTQYWGPSNWDATNRFSMTESYEVPGLVHGNTLLRRFTNGWQLASSTILQSGLPFTVDTTASFKPIFNAQGQVVGEKANGGDYNADGNNLDYPNAPSSGYQTATSRKAYLRGVLSASDFGIPTLGTEGNEKFNGFRNPGYADTDLGLLKNDNIGERVKLQLRFEFYNAFNRVNLGGVKNNLSSSTFGRVTSQRDPRWVQLGARLTF